MSFKDTQIAYLFVSSCGLHSEYLFYLFTPSDYSVLSLVSLYFPHITYQCLFLPLFRIKIISILHALLLNISIYPLLFAYVFQRPLLALLTVLLINSVILKYCSHLPSFGIWLMYVCACVSVCLLFLGKF